VNRAKPVSSNAETIATDHFERPGKASGIVD
jgi:hypothetical protein